MIAAYHIDDGDYITHAGQVLTLSNDFSYDWYTPEIRELCVDLFDGEGVAHFGANFLDSTPIIHRGGDLRSALIELCFEIVRKKHFPYLPSRFQSLFVCISEENVTLWKSILPFSPDTGLWVAEGNIAFLANAHLLQVSHFVSDQEYFDPALGRRMALAYWGTGKLLDATSDYAREMVLGKYDRDFLSAAGVQWGNKAQPEILLKYPVKIVRKC